MEALAAGPALPTGDDFFDLPKPDANTGSANDSIRPSNQNQKQFSIQKVSR